MATVTSRPIWTGSISFGLVTIPVRLFTAIREKRLSFRSLHDQDQVPLKQKMVCPADGKEVHAEHIVKGFEVEKDRFVIIRQDEIDSVMPKVSKAIEIQDFVNLTDIDPVYFDKPYYVVPKPEGIKPYQLLVKAMEKAGRVGIANVVMHTKEYLAAQAMIGWAKERCPAAVIVSEKLSRAILKEHFEQTGEVPDAGAHVEQGGERFFLR